jgi:hypothetical protein
MNATTIRDITLKTVQKKCLQRINFSIHRETFTYISFTYFTDVNTKPFKAWWVRVIVLNATFNNISVTSWRSVLLVEETGVPGEHHLPAASHWQTSLMAIGTYYIGSCESNYHTITTTTDSAIWRKYILWKLIC